MSWHYRKSISSGPFRMNFSKRSISYSVGVKGARVNFSPKGTFVNLSAHGINYRQRISGPNPTPTVQNIISANIDQLTDSDSKSFIEALNQKSSQLSYIKVFGILPLGIVLFILFSTSYWGYECFIIIGLFIPLIFWLKKLDKRRFEMELHYDMDEKLQQVYQQFNTHFDTFSRSSKIWQYYHTQHTNDQKRHAGASNLIKRSRINSVSKNKVPIPYFITNVTIPCISLRNMELYFLPERLLIKRGNTFAAVFYKHLSINFHTTRFIESEILPGDADVVDYTWQYVNRNGGPDKRFNNNRRLPVCAYSQYTFRSDTGMFEVISTSKTGGMDEFAMFLMRIGELQNKISEYH